MKNKEMSTYAEKLQKTSLRMRELYSTIQSNKILKYPPIIPYTKPVSNKCKAITMQNKPCPFKAVHGHFCSRHTVHN